MSAISSRGISDTAPVPSPSAISAWMMGDMPNSDMMRTIADSWLMCEGSMADFDAGSMRTAVSAATAEITPSMTIGR